MGINNYDGLSSIGKVEGGGKRYRTVYNNTGSAISNGAPKLLVEMWITGKGVVLVPAALATNANDTNEIGICANNPSGSIADGAYGQFLVEGLYGSLAEGFGVTTSGSVAANAQLQILNAATAFIDAGAVGGAIQVPEAIAMAVELVTTNTWAVYLLGKKVAILSS